MAYVKHSKVSRSYELVDAKMNGTLAMNLRGWRSSGHSFVWIADRIFENTGVRVSRGTPPNWCKALGIG